MSLSSQNDVRMSERELNRLGVPTQVADEGLTTNEAKYLPVSSTGLLRQNLLKVAVADLAIVW